VERTSKRACPAMPPQCASLSFVASGSNEVWFRRRRPNGRCGGELDS
jgi:hypothetical protein